MNYCSYAEGNINLAGGMITSAGTGDAYSGNTLHINQITVDLTDGGTTLSTVKNFENYEFTLAPDRDQSKAMLLADNIYQF